MIKQPPRLTVGVLALQGAFQLHEWHLVTSGANYQEVTKPSDFKNLNGLILPGGESSTLLKLIEWSHLTEELILFLNSKPIWGICAGAILMAKSVKNPKQHSFQTLDIEIERNAYGRQQESQEAWIENYLVSYIRAPRISQVGPHIQILHQREGSPTCLETSRILVTTFHPEINRSTPSPWHTRFLEKIRTFH